VGFSKPRRTGTAASWGGRNFHAAGMVDGGR
jgi:hypothetical protein